MKKDKNINKWLWRWHVIAGLIAMPFVVLLAITGAIYLFKPQVEAPIIEKYKQITSNTSVLLSLDAQLQAAHKVFGKPPTSVSISKNNNEATAFHRGRFSHKKTAYVNPHTAEVTGTFSPKSTWMYKVRKLHGELMMGKVGTLFIELIASWLVVLIFTGIYVYWPSKNKGLKGFYHIRTQKGKRTFYRDLHSVLGFWISGLLLLTLAGGLPWTDVFGGNFKKVQQITDTGFSKEWMGIGITSKVISNNQKETNTRKPLEVQQMYQIAQKQDLKGAITLYLPNNRNKGVFSVANQCFPLKEQQKKYFDAYSGQEIVSLDWQNHVGILLRARMWAMAFHQGQLGTWNLILMFLVSVLLSVISIAGIISYLKRKKQGAWSIPKTPESFKLELGGLLLVGMLCFVLPLFGISIALICVNNQIYRIIKIRSMNLKGSM